MRKFAMKLIVTGLIGIVASCNASVSEPPPTDCPPKEAPC